MLALKVYSNRWLFFRGESDEIGFHGGIRPYHTQCWDLPSRRLDVTQGQPNS